VIHAIHPGGLSRRSSRGGVFGRALLQESACECKAIVKRKYQVSSRLRAQLLGPELDLKDFCVRVALQILACGLSVDLKNALVKTAASRVQITLML